MPLRSCYWSPWRSARPPGFCPPPAELWGGAPRKGLIPLGGRRWGGRKLSSSGAPAATGPSVWTPGEEKVGPAPPQKGPDPACFRKKRVSLNTRGRPTTPSAPTHVAAGCLLTASRPLIRSHRPLSHHLGRLGTSPTRDAWDTGLAPPNSPVLHTCQISEGWEGIRDLSRPAGVIPGPSAVALRKKAPLFPLGW